MRDAFHFYADPGHGWLRVTEDDLADVGLTADSFSRYSYVNGPRFYLEEDCDAGVFLDAYTAKRGAAPVIFEHHSNGDSLIPTYTRLPGANRT
jgi:hypothetical protein